MHCLSFDKNLINHASIYQIKGPKAQSEHKTQKERNLWNKNLLTNQNKSELGAFKLISCGTTLAEFTFTEFTMSFFRLTIDWTIVHGGAGKF